VKRYTPNSATPIGANTMFLQIVQRYTPFSVLHQFFPTLPIIWAQVAAKRFMQNTRWCLFKIKKKNNNNVQRPKTEALPTD
jgi:hypothetical protein